MSLLCGVQQQPSGSRSGALAGPNCLHGGCAAQRVACCCRPCALLQDALEQSKAKLVAVVQASTRAHAAGRQPCLGTAAAPAGFIFGACRLCLTSALNPHTDQHPHVRNPSF